MTAAENCSIFIHRIFITLHCSVIIIFGVLISVVGTLFNFAPNHKKSIRDLLDLVDTEDPDLVTYSDSYGPIFYFILLAFLGLFVVILGALGILAVFYRQKKLLCIFQYVHGVCFLLFVLKSIHKSTKALVFSSTSFIILIVIALVIRSAYYIARDIERNERTKEEKSAYHQQMMPSIHINQ
jgi:hypothetical protein